MPRFFLHLRDNVDQLLDTEGVEVPEERIASVAVRCARDVIAGDVLSGTIDLNYRIDVENSEGNVVHSLPFTQAVRFAQPR